MTNPLFRACPGAEGRIPWLPLAELPTPVQRLEELPSWFSGELWVKRDDLTSPIYGGNKVRKLEYLLADARDRGAGRLITTGAVGSHHALATAVHGRRHGLPTTVVVFPQPDSQHSRDVAALNEAWADELCRCGTFATQPFVEAATRWRRRKEKPYVIPGGGSSPLGTLGYVTAALELAEQVADGSVPRPDRIWVAAGTLGTLAGLAIGTAMADLADGITGVRIVPAAMANELALGRLVEQTTAILKDAGISAPDPRLALDRVELAGGWLGKGYGHPTDAGSEAANWFGDRDVPMDPTYTAKTAAAVLEGMSREPATRHLYWHTLSAVDPDPLPGSEHQP